MINCVNCWRWWIAIVFIAALAESSQLMGDSIDDAEAKRRGIPVQQVLLENAQSRIAELEKQATELQSQIQKTKNIATTIPSARQGTSSDSVPITHGAVAQTQLIYRTNREANLVIGVEVPNDWIQNDKPSPGGLELAKLSGDLVESSVLINLVADSGKGINGYVDKYEARMRAIGHVPEKNIFKTASGDAANISFVDGGVFSRAFVQRVNDTTVLVVDQIASISAWAKCEPTLSAITASVRVGNAATTGHTPAELHFKTAPPSKDDLRSMASNLFWKIAFGTSYDECVKTLKGKGLVITSNHANETGVTQIYMAYSDDAEKTPLLEVTFLDSKMAGIAVSLDNLPNAGEVKHILLENLVSTWGQPSDQSEVSANWDLGADNVLNLTAQDKLVKVLYSNRKLAQEVVARVKNGDGK